MIDNELVLSGDVLRQSGVHRTSAGLTAAVLVGLGVRLTTECH
jgi:hypothetical protein